MSNNVNLLSSLSRVETPFVKVVIGDYVFGVAMKSNIVVNGNQVVQGNTYPNYIESLEIEKINGVVNNYTLSIRYAITQDDDPNFFNKVFSSVSKTRAITFEDKSYNVRIRRHVSPFVLLQKRGGLHHEGNGIGVGSVVGRVL